MSTKLRGYIKLLLKIAGHFPNNPNHIDKLISIKGLPEEWIFRNTKYGKELARPWIPDNEDTIPKAIRHLCEPTEISIVYSPVSKGEQGVVDKKTILGVKLDYGTEPGREMWEKVERYLDRMTPRDRKVPEPVMMAPNQKSEFNPTIGRRSIRGSMEFGPTEVPDVDLRTVVEEVPAPAKEILAAPVVTASNFKCMTCNREFTKKGPYAMHMNTHKVKSGV